LPISAGFINFTNNNFVDGNHSIDLIRDALLGCGWSFIGGLFATCHLIGPFGWGFISFQRRVVSIGTLAYFYYDPSFESAPSGVTGDGFVIQAVPNKPDAQAQLVAAITATSNFNASKFSATDILLTYKQIGTVGNNVPVFGQGSISIGGTSTGGGWTLQSGTQNALQGFGNTDFVQLTAYSGPQSGLLLDFNIHGTIITYNPGPGTWYLVSNTLSACFLGIALNPLDPRFGNSFVWGCTINFPQIVPDNPDTPSFTLISASFIAQGFGFRNTLWVLNPFNSVDSWINAVHTAGGVGTNGFSMMMYYSATKPIVEPVDDAIFQDPIVCLYTNPESRLVGYIPLGILCSKFFPSGQLFFHSDSKYYRVISSQQFNGSLLVQSGETQGEPVRPPVPTPHFQTGNGTASVFGPTVTAKSGTPFPQNIVNQIIVIDGVNYTVTQWIDAQHLIINPAGPVDPNATFSFSYQG